MNFKPIQMRFFIICSLFFNFVVLSAGAQFYVAAGEAIKVTSADELQVQENLNNNGTIDFLTLSGAAAQSVFGTGTITNLKLNKSAGTATCTGGMQSIVGTLNLTAGTLAANGYLTLKSTATGTARVESHTGAGTGSVTGNVHVERYIDVNNRPKQWRIMGFPYSANMQVSALTGFSIDYATPSVMYYNEGADDGLYGSSGTLRNAGYVSFTASNESLPTGRGVMAWIYGNGGGSASFGSNMSGNLTVSSSGPLNEDGNAVSMPVFHTAARAKHGWNLLSNPFASTIDWNSGSITKTNLNNAIYRWNPASSSWTTYNGTTGTPLGVDHYIESGAAFFVETSADNPVLSIGQGAKTSSATGFVHFSRFPNRIVLPSERVQNNARLSGVRISVSGQGNEFPEEAYLDISKADATEAFDGRYDATSMGRTSGAGIAIKDEKNNNYAMQFDRPITAAGSEKRYYPLRLTTPSTGATTLVLRTEGEWNPLNSVSLIDTKEHKTLMMRGGQLTHSFSLEELRSDGRFLLAINHVAVDGDGSAAFDVKVLGNPVRTSVVDLLVTHPTANAKQWRMVDANGREVGNGAFPTKETGVQHRLNVPGMRQPGVYFVQVQMDNGESRQLRILRK